MKVSDCNSFVGGGGGEKKRALVSRHACFWGGSGFPEGIYESCIGKKGYINTTYKLFPKINPLPNEKEKSSPSPPSLFVIIDAPREGRVSAQKPTYTLFCEPGTPPPGTNI